MTGRAALDEPRFPDAMCDALFAEILIDDEIDAHLVPPAPAQVDYSREELVGCFRLSRQLWLDGFDRAALLRFCGRFLAGASLPREDLVRLKHIRAKFKHFRYAHALYDSSHRYRRLFDRVTILMGKVQDAMRHGRPETIRSRGLLLRLMLAWPALRWLCHEGSRLRPASPAGFRALFASDAAKLEALLAGPTVTGHGFHCGRKVIGRQVSFWNTIHTLAPSEERYRMSRWLSAINGAMGAMHDDLAEARAADAASYHRAFALPAELRERIALFALRVREGLARAD